MIDEWLEAPSGSPLTRVKGGLANSGSTDPGPDADTRSTSSTGARPAPLSAVLRGAIALLRTQPLTWAASFLATLLLPRLLGDQNLGELGVATGIAGLAATFASIGLPDYLTRRVATKPQQANVDGSAALFLLTALAAVIAAGLFLATWFLRVPVALNGLLAVALVGVVAGAGNSVLFSLLMGRERLAYFAWLNAAGVVLTTCIGIAVLLAGGDIIRFMLSELAVTCIVTVVGWYMAGFGLHRAGLSPRLWVELARGGFPFLAWALALRIRNEIDVIMVGLLLRTQVAGWLTAAYRVVYIPIFIPTLITTPLLPALSRHIDDHALFCQTVRRSVVLVLKLTVPVSALMMAISPAIPDLLRWTPEFYHAVPVITILSVEQPLMAIDMILGTALIALHQERRWLRVGVAAAIFNPVTNLLLLPLFDMALQNGAIGAAVAEGATELLMLFGALVLLPRGTVDRKTASSGARVVLAGSCLATVTATLRPFSLFLSIAAGSVVFIAVAVALGVLRWADLTTIRDLVVARRVPTDSNAVGRVDDQRTTI